MNRWTAIFAAAVGFYAAMQITPVQAQETPAKVSFLFNGSMIKIDRENKKAADYAASFTANGGTCGAACIAPMKAANGVATLDEPQVLSFLVDEVANSQGLMVDARTPEERARGFIPGSINLPYSTVDPKQNYWPGVVTALGAKVQSGGFDFADVQALLVYDTGPSSDEAGKLVRNLIEVGYPADKIKYYRGGMQVWSVLGFNIEEGRS